MEDLKKIGQDLLSKLKGSSSMVYGGRVNEKEIMVWEKDGEIVFAQNLGGNNVPTKKEASEMLYNINNYFDALCEKSILFCTYCKDKEFVARLLVFSGQMDFDVCSLYKSGVITWHTNLK